MAAPPPWIPPGVVGWPPNGLSGGMHSRLLGFVKTVLLRQLVSSNSLVCDLFCGRGLDTERWAEAEIGRYIGVDLSASALEEAQEQWEQRDRPFPAEFCELDPCMVDFEAHLQDKGLPADVVSCLAHLQDSFTSEEIVKRLLKNVEAVLKPGGFFFGTAPDSSTIWYKYQKAVQEAMKAGSLRVNGTLPAVRTEMYKITFDDDRFLPFGSKYHMRFTDDGLPPQPQLLVHFPSLIRLAKEVGLECVEIQNLMEFYDDNSGPFADVLRSCCGSLVDLKGVPVLDAKGRLNGPAMDVLSLYTTFIFKKGDSAVPNSFEPAFKASNSAAKYLTNFPSQHSENFSYTVDGEVGRKEQDPVKSKENGLLLVNGTIPSKVAKKQRQQDSYQANSETKVEGPDKDLPASRPHRETWHDKEEEVSEVKHEASPSQVNNHTDDLSQGLTDEDPTKRQSSGPSRSASQMDRSLEEGHPAMEELHDHPVGGTHPRTWPSKDAPNSRLIILNSDDPRTVSSKEKEQIHSRTSASTAQRTSRRLSASRPSPSTEVEQVHSMEIERVEKPPAADQSSNHRQGGNDSLDESSRVGQRQEPSLPDHSLQCSPRGTSERMDESSRGEEQQESPLADRSPKHYMRRGHDKSTTGDNQQELAHGDHTSKHYLRRTHENRNESKRSEKQQDQQSTDNHSKRHQQSALEGVDQSSRRNKKKEPSAQDLPSRHYERRTNDDPDERSRNGKQQEPLAVDTPSKHYTRRNSDSFNDRHKSEEAYDKGGPHSGRSKWAGRSGSLQEPNRVLHSSQGGRASRVAVKKFSANSGKQNAGTAYVEGDLP